MKCYEVEWDDGYTTYTLYTLAETPGQARMWFMFGADYNDIGASFIEVYARRYPRFDDSFYMVEGDLYRLADCGPESVGHSWT